MSIAYLAHGKGVAVSLDGDFVVADGVFVLGQFVAGELIEIPPKVTSMRVGNSNG